MSFTKTTVQIPSSTPGWNLDTWKYEPTAQPGALMPAIVMAHGFAANKKMTLSHYAKAFASAGYVCFVFDYRHWGESDGAPRNLLNVQEQLDDYRAVVKYARQQSDLDPQKIVIWGTSFSGAHAITLAADHAINAYAGIAQCPYVGGGAPPDISLAFLYTVFLSLLDAVKLKLGLHPVYIPVSASPGKVGALTVEGTVVGMASLCEDFADHENTVSASSLLQVATYTPQANSDQIQCPLLIIAPVGDKLCSFPGMKDVVKRAEKGEIYKVDGGHFDVYPRGSQYLRSIEAQLAFLKSHIPV